MFNFFNKKPASYVTEEHDFFEAISKVEKTFYLKAVLPVSNSATIVRSSSGKRYFCETINGDNGRIFMRVTEYIL
jgi:hypothetical protein